jgi:hypothetical protein
VILGDLLPQGGEDLLGRREPFGGGAHDDPPLRVRAERS